MKISIVSGTENLSQSIIPVNPPDFCLTKQAFRAAAMPPENPFMTVGET
ncbi:MAG: hypothetical protein ACLQVJ_01405 [Syntrophobacteraceae bacterium]